MLKSLLRPSMIFAAFGTGFLIPAAAELTWLIRYLLMTMLFIVFLRVRFNKLKPRKTHWHILAANLAVGIGAWLVTLLTGSTTLAHAAFFTGIIPTASAAPVIVKFLSGNTEFVITAFLITNTGVTLSLIGLIPLVTGNLTFGFLLRVAGNLFFVIGVPMGLALLVRHFYSRAAEWGERLAGLSFMIWVTMLFLTAASASAFLRQTAISASILWEIAGLSAFLCILNFTLGALISEKRYRREASQSLGQKNTMLLLYITLTFAGPLAALGPTFYVLWHNIWNAVQLYINDCRKNRKQMKRRAA